MLTPSNGACAMLLTMAGHRSKLARIEFSFELLGRQSVGARQFDFFETKITHLVERAGHVLGKRVA
jgi:hypothetical protein